MTKPTMNRRLALLLMLLIAVTPAVHAAGPANQDLIAAQRKAMEVFAPFDGAWRGEATALNPDGSTLRLTQTERMGPLLDGAVRVVEGSGYASDGRRVFNAFAVLSFSVQTGTYSLRSWAQGFGGEFPVELVPGGYAWSLRAGPASIRYTATMVDGEWTEVGERIVEGRPPMKIFEMRLRRLGDSGWPAGDAVSR